MCRCHVYKIMRFLFHRHADLTLSELYLSHNKLRNITREVFGSMSMLQYLDLSHNYIFDLEYDCFKKVRNLQVKLLAPIYELNVTATANETNIVSAELTCHVFLGLLPIPATSNHCFLKTTLLNFTLVKA